MEEIQLYGGTSYPASTDQKLDLLWSEQVFERWLVGDHVEASPERFELLLHTFVQNIVCILCNKLLKIKHITESSLFTS